MSSQKQSGGEVPAIKRHLDRIVGQGTVAKTLKDAGLKG